MKYSECSQRIARGENVHVRDSKRKWTLLHLMAYHSDENPLVHDLINCGIDVNARTIDGESALQKAAVCSNPWVVKALLENDALRLADGELMAIFDLAAANRPDAGSARSLRYFGVLCMLGDKNKRNQK